MFLREASGECAELVVLEGEAVLEVGYQVGQPVDICLCGSELLFQVLDVLFEPFDDGLVAAAFLEAPTSTHHPCKRHVPVPSEGLFSRPLAFQAGPGGSFAPVEMLWPVAHYFNNLITGQDRLIIT